VLSSIYPAKPASNPCGAPEPSNIVLQTASPLGIQSFPLDRFIPVVCGLLWSSYRGRSVVNLLQRRKTQIMAKTICKILGVIFLLVGIVGFAAPTLLGAHLTPPHNLVHIVSGIVALYFGFAGSLSGAKGFCLLFGVVYLALGFLGMFVLGDAAMNRMWQVGPLVLGQVDHLIHILLGAIFLAGGLFTKNTSS